jgi:hypothetical protein
MQAECDRYFEAGVTDGLTRFRRLGTCYGRLILDSGVVIGQFWRNGLFLQAFPGGRDRCGFFGKSHLLSSAYVLYRVCKTPESNMSLTGMPVAWDDERE